MRSNFFYGHSDKNLIVLPGSLTWTTPEKTATVIKSIVDDVFAGIEKVTILNMTGNCGGDSFPFVDDKKYSGKIYELDPVIFDVLEGNIVQFSGHERWTLINDDSTKDTGKYDLVYCDPPFGLEYKTAKSGKLIKDWPRLGNFLMHELILHMSRSDSGRFLLKLPRFGFDIGHFVDVLKDSYKIIKYDPEELDIIGGSKKGTNKVLLVLLEKLI